MIAAYRTVAANRNLLRLFTGEFVSNIGDWLYLVALLVVVYRESSDPFLLGVIGGARIIPYVLLSVPAGIVVDRYDRRAVLIVTDLIRGLDDDRAGREHVPRRPGPADRRPGDLRDLLRGLLPARRWAPTCPRSSAPRPSWDPPNSVYATLGEITFVIGPAVAGLIIAATDLGWAFVINAVSFLAPVAILWSLPPNDPRAAAKAAARRPNDGGDASASRGRRGFGRRGFGRRRRRQPRSSVRSILRPVAGLAIFDIVTGFFWGGLSVALVIFAVDRLGAGEDATGYLWAAVGVGGVLGAVASSSIILRPNLGPILLLGSIILSVGFLVLGIVETLPLALAGDGRAGGRRAARPGRRRDGPPAGGPGRDPRSDPRHPPDAEHAHVRGGFVRRARPHGQHRGAGDPDRRRHRGPRRRDRDIRARRPALPAAGRPLDEAAATLGRVARLPLFAGVPPAALEVAVTRLVPVAVAAGDAVVREGDPADRFYIIESGRFAVDQLDPGTGLQRRLRVMGPDDVFGELGLMHNSPRSATVTAETDGRLLALDGPDFLELLNVGPELSGRMLDRYRASSAPPS